jgi:hypothetical protein
MRRFFSLATAVALLVGALAFPSSVAASSNGAFVFRTEGCGVLDGNGNYYADYSSSVHGVINASTRWSNRLQTARKPP